MGKYNILIRRSAVKAIKLLPSKDMKRILLRIQSLSDDPRPFGSKKLLGEEKYRIRHGRYRVVYKIEDAVLVICVIVVGHRRDIYR